jgi:hypothetical protein
MNKEVTMLTLRPAAAVRVITIKSISADTQPLFVVTDDGNAFAERKHSNETEAQADIDNRAATYRSYGLLVRLVTS